MYIILMQKILTWFIVGVIILFFIGLFWIELDFYLMHKRWEKKYGKEYADRLRDHWI